MIGLLTFTFAQTGLWCKPPGIPVSCENAVRCRALLCLYDIPPPPILTLARSAALV